jgi:hypothetical protein
VGQHFGRTADAARRAIGWNRRLCVRGRLADHVQGPAWTSYCPAFSITKVGDYIQGQGLPPGKTIKGCAYVGYCGLAKPKFVGIYETTDVRIGCPQFCLLKIDDYTGETTGKPFCFDFAFPNDGLASAP